MCAELGVSTSGYYAWREREPSARQLQDGVLTALIQAAHKELDGNPGVRRTWAHLTAAGWRIGHKRVHRLMQAAQLQGRHPKAWKITTVAGEKPVNAPDLISRNFTAAEANTAWCGDITYIKTWDGWAYLATVIDLHSRALVGWALDTHMRTSLVTDALDMAIERRQPKAPVIYHSDRGTQFTSNAFAEYCVDNKIIRSLGRTGVCYDNAVAESFFATYKKELIHTKPWPSLKRLRQETFLWIEGYYNTRRRHSTLGYLTPHEIELGYKSIHELAA
jgi:transposase InsO family protein